MKTDGKKINKIIGEAVLISPLLVLSIFLDLWSECTLIIILLFIYKSRYPLQYHADKNIVCIALSYATVGIGLLIAYVFKREYVLLIIVFNAVAYISARVGYLQRKAQAYDLIEKPYYELVEFYEKNMHKDFNIDFCTEEELRRRCQEKQISKANTELAVEFFINKTPHKILADRLFIEEKSVTRKKMRLKEKLK